MKWIRLLVAAMLLAAVALHRPEAHASTGARALGFLPEDMVLVATWNMARSRLSTAGVELIDAFAQSRGMGGAMERLRVRAGVDWKQDVETVLFAAAADDSKAELPRVVIVVEGRFDRDKLIAAAEDEATSFAARAHRDIAYYQSDDVEIAVVDTHWVIVTKGMMPEVIDVFRGKARSIKDNPRFGELLKAGDMTKDMWLAFVLSEELRKDIVSATGGHSIDRILANVDLKKQVRIRVQLGMSSEEAVVAVGSLLRSGQAPALVALGLGPLLANMTISRKDKNLELTIKPTDQDMAKLRQHLRGRRPSDSKAAGTAAPAQAAPTPAKPGDTRREPTSVKSEDTKGARTEPKTAPKVAPKTAPKPAPKTDKAGARPAN